MDLSNINVESLNIEDLKRLVTELSSGPKEGWTNSKGVSPLKLQLQIMKRLLEETKKEYQKEHLKQVNLLTGMAIQQTRPTRINKNVDKR